MLETAIIGGLSSLASGIFGAQAASKQRKAARQAANYNDSMIAQGNDIYQARVPGIAASYDPWVNNGTAASAEQANLMGLNGLGARGEAQGRFQADPGYQFQMDQGLGQLDSRAASRGMLNSGAAAKDSLRFSQGLADQSYGNYYNRLGGLSQMGLGANQLQAGINERAAQTELTSRQARGAGHLQMVPQINQGYQNEANAMNGMLQGLSGAASSYFGNQAGMQGSNQPMQLLGSPSQLSSATAPQQDIRGSSYASPFGFLSNLFQR